MRGLSQRGRLGGRHIDGWLAGSSQQGSSNNRRGVWRDTSGTILRRWGPEPAAPAPSLDDLVAADFAAEMERVDEPRMQGYSDKMRRALEEGDCSFAWGVIEDMWREKAEPDPWMYSTAIEICFQANETQRAEKLQEEFRSWGELPNLQRFQLAPVCSWGRQLRMAGCSVHNSLDWKGSHPAPTPPSDGKSPGAERRCWLLPAQDDAAEVIAEREIELQQAGWRVLTCDPALIATLRDKAALHELAEVRGFSASMPERYAQPANASYPCILKPSRGTWGKDAHIVYSSEEVLRIVQRNKIFEVEQQAEQQAEYYAQSVSGYGSRFEDDPFDNMEDEDYGNWRAEVLQKAQEAVNEWMAAAELEDIPSSWVLQELVPGKYEYSTSLLVSKGEILDAVCSRYEYSSDIYIWPQLEYLVSEYVSVPESHLALMRAMLGDFSGICNFNYKVRPNGEMCIFEVNPRIGGDLVFDVPKKRLRVLFEKLDAML